MNKAGLTPLAVAAAAGAGAVVDVLLKVGTADGDCCGYKGKGTAKRPLRAAVLLEGIRQTGLLCVHCVLGGRACDYVAYWRSARSSWLRGRGDAGRCLGHRAGGPVL